MLLLDPHSAGAEPCGDLAQPLLSSGGKSHITGAGGEGSALLDPQGWRP